MTRLAGGVAWICALLLCSFCGAQESGGIHGNVFREDGMGLTYEFPEKFSPKVGSEMPPPFRNATGREHFILTLWDAPQSGGALRMAFLYDSKQRSSDRTHDTIALAYIGEIKGNWLGVKDVKIVGPTKVSETSYDYWRLDCSAPDQVPRYNAAIVITLSDRRVLAIKAGAPSPAELDREVDSLARMRFDKSQKE
jgi:hypothetical protein